MSVPESTTTSLVTDHSITVVTKHPEVYEVQSVDIRTYKRRFWILFVFSIVAFYQCLLWNNWGPISDSMSAAFPNWGSSTVALLSNWGEITLVLFLFPMSWLMNVMNLRGPVVTFVTLIALGTILRCFSEHPMTFTAMSHICGIFNGIAGTLVMCCAAMVPVRWFPPKERTTATAVIMAANQLGVAGSYLQTLLVDSPGQESSEDIKWSIMNLMFIEAGIAVAILIAVVAYFPDRPPCPPSITSTTERPHFMPAFKGMLKNKDLMLIFLAVAMACGVSWSWVGVLNYSLTDLGIQQNEAMGVGISMSIAQTVSGIAAGRLTDIMYGYHKATLIAFIMGTCGSAYWFGLLSWGTIPVVRWQVYASVIGIFAFNFAIMPIFVDYAIEIGYPCPEQVIIAAMYTILGLISSIFLIIFSVVPQGSYGWVIYCLLASSSFSIFPLLLVKTNYARTKVDNDAQNRTEKSVSLS